MAIETVTAETGYIVELDDFKRELALWDPADDARAQLLLQAATDYCQRWSERTLRLSATRTSATEEWPSCGWTLKHPPVTAVSSITYYDTNNSEQTLSSSYYQTNITEDGFAKVEYTPSAVLPALYDRQDAVKVTYTVGYSTAADAPAAAKYAIILVGKWLIGEDGNLKHLYEKQIEDAAISLLSTVSAPSYA